MKVLVSACLLGRNCKYNGSNNYNESVIAFLKDKEIVEYCPEVMAGMGVPRTPMEIVNGVLTDRDGNILEEVMNRTVEKALAQITEMGVDCAVLQSRSPTCGVNQVYDGTFSGRLVKGQGVFARALQNIGIRIIDAEDLQCSY